MEAFTCGNASCAKENRVTGVGQENGLLFVICVHCGKKNRVELIADSRPNSVAFRVIGLLDKADEKRQA